MKENTIVHKAEISEAKVEGNTVLKVKESEAKVKGKTSVSQLIKSDAIVNGHTPMLHKAAKSEDMAKGNTRQLTTSFVNVSLKFQTLMSQVRQYFC